MDSSWFKIDMNCMLISNATGLSSANVSGLIAPDVLILMPSELSLSICCFSIDCSYMPSLRVRLPLAYLTLELSRLSSSLLLGCIIAALSCYGVMFCCIEICVLVILLSSLVNCSLSDSILDRYIFTRMSFSASWATSV